MNQNDLTAQAQQLIDRLQAFVASAQAPAGVEHAATLVEPFMFLLTIFLLACFVGYYVVWNVTPALHSPLMGVTNAISSVIVVGAILAVGLGDSDLAKGFGLAAAALASVNIFGGFIVTRRMLAMFQSKKKG
jgi:NAD(P) transhydrogenase subunit alpha